MADSKCKQCGARFDVPGAVGSLDEHMTSFHPGVSKSAKAKSQDDPTPQEAIDALEAAVSRIGELEGLLGEARAENEQLKADLAAASGGDQTPTKDVDDMSKDELVQLAEAKGIDSSGNKPELLERIKAAKD